jgi:hypothetical protein
MAFKRKSPSVHGLLTVGLILVIGPALPQYHFSLFWFSLGVLSVVIATCDLLRSPSIDRSNAKSGALPSGAGAPTFSRPP